jgi:protein involved in polysaccharide export with SLBB domain
MNRFKKITVMLLVLCQLWQPAILQAETEEKETAVQAEEPSSEAGSESAGSDQAVSTESSESSKIEDELSTTFDEAVPEKPVVQSSREFRKKRKEEPLEAGDRLKIKIYPEDDYIKGGDMQVSSEGNITLPLIGKVKVGGKTPIEAEREIVQIIDKDFLVNPEVVIEVMTKSEIEEKRTVIVFGQVRKPGPYDFPPDKEHMTLLEVISAAGGFTEIANFKKIKIVRKQGGEKSVINVNGEAVMSGDESDVQLMNGDVITVSESLF